MNIFKRTGGRKKPDEMSQFLASNAISYNKMTVVGNNKVRFMNQKTDGSTDMQQAINKQTELYLKRVNERSQRGVLVRKYKVGELPDIQICGRDLIDPLMLLAFSDTELSGELFGLLFECICQTDSRESVKQFKNLLPDLLSRSQKLNFSFVSTLQKSLITLMKEMKEKIDFRMLSIAQRSNSYEYSVLFV
jgi:DNA-dependent protein kinase catalytic subunit